MAMRILFVCMGNICRSPTAEGAKDNCPISGALKGNLELSVDAQLA